MKINPVPMVKELIFLFHWIKSCICLPTRLQVKCRATKLLIQIFSNSYFGKVPLLPVQAIGSLY